jgi:putative ABC transport system substrate-binding protein
MTRRELIALLFTVAAPAAAPAQGRTFRLGMLVNTRDALADELIKALRDLGYTEGQNLTVEWRFAQGVAERWLLLARELVALKVDAIVVPTTPAALAARQATKTIPIVLPTAIDPVGAGLAESLARPGGNVTGFSVMSPEISAKALSLLKEAVPALRRVAVLWNAANPAFTSVWQSVNAVAGSLDLTLVSEPVREPEDFPAAFAGLIWRPCCARQPITSTEFSKVKAPLLCRSSSRQRSSWSSISRPRRRLASPCRNCY